MLLDVYIIDEEGEDVQIKPSDVKLTSSTLAIIVSHTDHVTYVFKGAKVSVVQKFASARKAATLRLQHAYKTRHVEELEGIDDVFIPIMDFLGGFHGDAGSSETPKPVENSPPPKPAVKPAEKPPVKPAAKPTAKAEIKSTVKTTTKKTTETKEESEAPALVGLATKLTSVVKLMMSLEPPEGSSCDYLLAGAKLYIILGDDKIDLRNGNFRLEEISTLPEGVFPAENYYPRILVKNQKILGVELWARR